MANVTTLDYLKSKATEYSIVLEWLDSEITAITSKTPHSYLIELLQNKISALQDLQSRLQTILQIGYDRLINRAQIIIRDIGYQLYGLTWYYIPGLKREGNDDLSLRDLLLSKIEPCGLSWIQDILLRLDGRHATFIGLRDLEEIPLIFAPPQQAKSLLGMTYYYHELGHNIFSHFEEIGNALYEVVTQHFNRLQLESGPMSPEKRDERTREIEKSVDYWVYERLSEIFSDIYATYICGPAYYFSYTNMIMGLYRNPFKIFVMDAHPPDAARVSACYKTLLPTHQQSELTSSIQMVWDDYLSTHSKPSDFDLICNESLIDSLVMMSIHKIEQLLPDAYRYSEAQDSLEEQIVNSSDSLESILNKGIRTLLKDPENYTEWEKKAFSALSMQS